MFILTAHSASQHAQGEQLLLLDTSTGIFLGLIWGQISAPSQLKKVSKKLAKMVYIIPNFLVFHFGENFMIFLTKIAKYLFMGFQYTKGLKYFKFLSICLQVTVIIVAAMEEVREALFIHYIPRVSTSSGNQGKPENHKKVPCIEKSWNSKKPE